MAGSALTSRYPVNPAYLHVCQKFDTPALMPGIYPHYDNKHSGVDFRTCNITTLSILHHVLAPMSGIVVKVFTEGMGHIVQIRNGNCTTIAAHLSQVNVKMGDIVLAGQVVGISGASGTTGTWGPFDKDAEVHIPNISGVQLKFVKKSPTNISGVFDLYFMLDGFKGFREAYFVFTDVFVEQLDLFQEGKSFAANDILGKAHTNSVLMFPHTHFEVRMLTDKFHSGFEVIEPKFNAPLAWYLPEFSRSITSENTTRTLKGLAKIYFGDEKHWGLIFSRNSELLLGVGTDDALIGMTLTIPNYDYQ